MSIEIQPHRREYVRRSTNSMCNEWYKNKTVKYGGNSLMVLCDIKSDGSRTLVRCTARLNTVEYRNVLVHDLLPLYDVDNIFQQDETLCHTLTSSISFLENHEIRLISN